MACRSLHCSHPFSIPCQNAAGGRSVNGAFSLHQHHCVPSLGLDHREQRRTQAKDRHVDQQTVRVVGGGYWLVKSWHHHMNTTVTVNEES